MLAVFGIPVNAEDFRAKVQTKVEQLQEGDPMQLKILRGGRLMVLNNTYFDGLVPSAPVAARD